MWNVSRKIKTNKKAQKGRLIEGGTRPVEQEDRLNIHALNFEYISISYIKSIRYDVFVCVYIHD
jgi:hypothetical protein